MSALNSWPRRRLPPALTDLALGVLLTGWCLALPSLVPASEALHNAPGGWWVALILVCGAPITVHHRFPLASLVVVAVTCSILQALGYVPHLVGPQGTAISPTYLCAATALFLTAVRTERRTAALVALLHVPALSVTEAVLAPAGHWLAAGMTEAVLTAAAWSLGRLVRTRTAMQDQALERAKALEGEQLAKARAAVMEERARIARELHDIVAHNVSLMIVQTIAADRVQARDPEKAHELHRTIEETGRATVAELRQLLDVLRTDDEDDTDPSKQPPQPTIDAIPALLESVRAAGLQVHCAISGEPADLSAGSQLAVYRIVQEALTNTLKHAGRTRTAVTLAWEHDRRMLSLRICDAGPGEQAAPSPAHVFDRGAGHGLVGIRERVAAMGGTLHTGHRPGGGYCVHAALPLPSVYGPPPPDDRSSCVLADPVGHEDGTGSHDDGTGSHDDEAGTVLALPVT
ncbi:two-component sensor histidine kinase [Streptomyces griseoflavus]|uniref:sensor histidine kinase n=1 Tax=Streptomyces griseoflavus TaxID=35619 RepID=UPI00167E0A1D|nr:sensor histidine kinase [Streptomyces griseoflavus]GGV29487.1 two-component sensor histidine kinase [Streptomyces griseoflavus]